MHISLGLAAEIVEKVKTAYFELKKLHEGQNEKVAEILAKGEEFADLVEKAADDVTEIGLLIFEVYDQYFKPGSRHLPYAPKELEEVQTRDDLIEYIANQISAEVDEG